MNTCPPLVTMKVLKELFPGKAEATVWRWNSVGGRGMRLPTPDAVNEPGNPVWSLGTILEWAERTGVRNEMSESVLARICQSEAV
jgi:hypothetical protein